MDIEIANTIDPKPCPTCETVTARQYRLDPRGADNEEYRVCEACIDDQINSYNDALYGRREWYNDDDPELSDSELLQVIETEFVRNSGGLRWDSRILKGAGHLDQAEYLVEKGHAATGTIGVDEAKSFRPTAERRLELIKTFNLFTEWGVSMSRRQTIQDEIRDELGQSVSFS